MITRRILTDPLLWCLLLLLALVFGMPHMTRLFSALDRQVYRQDSFASLAFAHLWLVLVSSYDCRGYRRWRRHLGDTAVVPGVSPAAGNHVGGGANVPDGGGAGHGI